MSSCCDRYRCRCDARLYLAISVTALIDGFLFVCFIFFFTACTFTRRKERTEIQQVFRFPPTEIKKGKKKRREGRDFFRTMAIETECDGRTIRCRRQRFGLLSAHNSSSASHSHLTPHIQAKKWPAFTNTLPHSHSHERNPHPRLL